MTAPATEARKVVTVLFADLVGSTRLQEALDPESARRVVDRFTSAMAEVVAEFRGTVVKTMGDGLMAAWGVPTVSEDDAVRGVRAALAMHERLEALNERLAEERGLRLQMRIGLNTGEVVVGADGDVIGDPVNVAARLESAAPPGGVLVGEQTRRLVRGVVALEETAPLALRGKGLPVAAWRAVEGPAAGPGPAEAPFVAREAELARLVAALDAAVAAREARLVTVVGSPGMGKSRLAAEFAARVAGRARVVEGRCEQSGEGITFLPVAEVLRALAGVTGTADPEAVLAGLRERLGADDPDAPRIAERAAGVVGLGDAGPPQETFWAVRRLLEAAAQAQPLVVVLDDVHWGEPQFLELVEHVAAWSSGAPLLLVTLARPELRDVRAALCERGPLVLDVIELVPLDAAASLALAAGVLGTGADPPPALADRVVEATGGNPLFLAETLRMLMGDGALRRENGAWVAESSDVEVPPTIHALLAARLERLAAGERQVVERASVIGKSFPRGGVRALLPAEAGAPLDAHLDGLRRRELVEPEGTFFIDEPVFRFHHVLIRDAAYRALLKESRAELHERFATWLTERAGERLGEHEEVVGYHLEQAHEYRRQLGMLDERTAGLGRRAAERLGSSGRRALAREDLAAAANLLERALVRGGEDAGLLGDLVEVHLSAGDSAAAEDALDRLDLCVGRDPLGRARVALGGVELGRLTGELGLRDAERELLSAAEVLEGACDDAGHAKALELLARCIAPLGRIAEAEAVLDRALTVARRADDRRRVTAVLSAAPIVALYGPSPVPRASGRCLDVVRILRMGQGNRHVEARALRCQAVLEAMRGRAGAARAILAGARATFEELGLRLDLLELGTFDALVELLLGEPAAAESGLRVTAEGLDELGGGGAFAYALLARALVDQGRHDEAITASHGAEARAGDDLQATALWMRVRAEALAERGDLREALELAKQAVGLADGTDALADHADCRLALARVLRAAGRPEESAAEATLAAELYARKGHEVGVTRARALGATPPPVPRAIRPDDPAAPAPPAPPSRSDTTPARLIRQEAVNFAARDWAAQRELYAAGFRLRDHRRSVLHPEVAGPEETVAALRTMFGPDTQMDSPQTLLEDERVHLRRLRLVGTGPGDVGAFEIEWLLLVLVSGDRMLRSEAFEVEDEHAARARAAELQRTPTSELLFREYVELFRARDWARLRAMYAPDYAFSDRRMLGWEPTGPSDAIAAARSVAELFPDLDVEFAVLDADDDAFLLRSRWHGHAADGGGEVEYELLETGSHRGGLFLTTAWFSPEQEVEARALLAGLRAPAREQPVAERRYREHLRAFREGDWETVAALFAEDFRLTDRRLLGWEVLDREAMIRTSRSVSAEYPGLHGTMEVLESSDRAVLTRTRWSGHALRGGGEVEYVMLEVVAQRHGLLATIDWFSPTREDEARARLAEVVSGAGGAGPTTGEMAVHRMLDAFRRRDFEAMRALAHPDALLYDHRPVIGGVRTLDEFVGRQEELLQSVAADARVDVDQVVDAGREHVVVRWTLRGTADGALIEAPIVLAFVLRDGLLWRAGQWDGEQVEEARAWCSVACRSDRLDLGSDVLALAVSAVGAVNRQDITAASALFAEDASFVDHRPLGRGAMGREEWADSTRRLVELGAWRYETRAVWFLDDERILGVTAYAGTSTDGGPVEIEYLTILRVAGTRIVVNEVLDLADVSQAWRRLLAHGADPLEAERARVLTEARAAPGPQPPGDLVRLAVEYGACTNVPDLDRLRGLLHDDFVSRDHRPVGDADADADTHVSRVRSLHDVMPGVRGVIRRWLACGPDHADVHVAYGTTHADGAHTEWEWAMRIVHRDGRFVSFDAYAVDDAPAGDPPADDPS